MNEIIDPIFRTIMNLPQSFEIEGSTIENLAGWDSLRHMNLIVELENKFDVKFNAKDVIQMRSYQAILEVLKKKKGH